MHYYNYGPGYNFGHDMFSTFGAVLHLIFWLIIIAIIIRFIKRRKGTGDWRMFRHGGNSAVEILKERYAKGEIDKAEFEEKKKVLE